jgi:guanylate kinase
MNPRLLLLTGPSGSGKSTLILRLQKRDPRFRYVKPYTTRPLRSGESDKLSVSNRELAQLWEEGELLVINELYGVKYGTPKRPISDCFVVGEFPILDWPITHLRIMDQAFPGKLCTIYIRPPSLAVLADRLHGRNNYDERLATAEKELSRVDAHEFDDRIDLTVVTADDTIEGCVEQIYMAYASSL